MVRRTRRDRPELRQELLEAALVEFGAYGYDGASTLAIARRAGAHQPQINYHFESKEALWRAAVDHVFGQLREALGTAPAPPAASGDLLSLTREVAEYLRRFVRFAAAHPELNRIITHEATTRTPRLDWLVEHHVRRYADATSALWVRLRDAGIAAPIDERLLHHVVVGAASLLFVNAPEFELLTGEKADDPAWVERHADGIVRMLLPGAGAI